MSYKAFGKIKEHMEIKTLKSMPYEDINKRLNEQHEEIRALRAAIGQISEYAMQIPLHYSGINVHGENHIDHYVDQILAHCKSVDIEE